MPQTFRKLQNRGGQASLIAVYLAVAVAVVGMVVSRWPEGESPPSMVQPVGAVSGSPSLRLFRPEAFAEENRQPGESLRSAESSAPAVTEVTDARPVAGEEESTPAAQMTDTEPAAAPVAAVALPVEPLPSWTENELIAELEATAVELDLHSGQPDLEQARADVLDASEEFRLYGERFDRKRQFEKRLRNNPGDVLPGERELVDDVGQKPVADHLIEDWVAGRSDLQGLPLRLDDSCTLPAQDATTLMRVSRMSLGHRMRMKAPSGLTGVHADLIATSLVEDTSAIVQVLQCESQVLRARMIKLLSLKDDDEARQAIADRALFDVSAEIRSLAIHMLKMDTTEAVRERLVSGFDHVWQPVAVNAANALVELDDELSLPQLRSKLDVPGPHAPFQDEQGRWRIRELVRVNHLRNCLMCHAPALEKSRTFTATVPEPGRKLPRVYYGDGSPRVRPDVTYIIQDFSLMHDMRNQTPWPDRQRFDYFVRERVIDAADAAKRNEESDEESIRNRSLRYAIQRLSGEASSETSLAQNSGGSDV